MCSGNLENNAPSRLFGWQTSETSSQPLISQD